MHLTRRTSARHRLRRRLNSYAVAKRLKHLDLRGRRDLLDLFTKSAGELLDSYFEGEPLKPRSAGIRWSAISPARVHAGQRHVLLHHLFGEVNGKPGTWGHAIGGMGAITRAMRAECEARGVAIETNAEIAKLLVEDGRGRRRAGDGRDCARRPSPRNLNPKLLYSKLVERSQLDDDTAQRIDRYRCGSGTFRMNVALSELPDFTAMPGTQAQPHHSSGILIGPSLRYFEQAYFDAKSKAYNAGWAQTHRRGRGFPRPWTTRCAARPARGQPVLPAGESRGSGGWDAHRDTVAKLMIDTVNEYAPNFAQRHRLRGAVAARPRTPHRPGRRRHLPRRARPGPDVQRARCWGRATIAARSRTSISAVPAPIPAAASPACQAATPHARS